MRWMNSPPDWLISNCLIDLTDFNWLQTLREKHDLLPTPPTTNSFPKNSSRSVILSSTTTLESKRKGTQNNSLNEDNTHFLSTHTPQLRVRALTSQRSSGGAWKHSWLMYRSFYHKWQSVDCKESCRLTLFKNWHKIKINSNKRLMFIGLR